MQGPALARVAAVVAVVAATVAARIPHRAVLPGSTVVHGIVNERACYPDSVMAVRRQQAKRIGEMVKGIDARYAIPGGQASLAYYARLPHVVERNGLTDREVAHRAIPQRGRPGHEKMVAEPDLRLRGVDFLFRVKGDSVPGAINQIWFGENVALIVEYERPIMDALRQRPGVRFIDFPAYLDAYLEQMNAVPTEALAPAWDFFQTYYFKHNDDVALQQRTRDAFVAAHDARAGMKRETP
jgi:hypothetical protein